MLGSKDFPTPLFHKEFPNHVLLHDDFALCVFHWFYWHHHFRGFRRHHY